MGIGPGFNPDGGGLERSLAGDGHFDLPSEIEGHHEIVIGPQLVIKSRVRFSCGVLALFLDCGLELFLHGGDRGRDLDVVIDRGGKDVAK